MRWLLLLISLLTGCAKIALKPPPSKEIPLVRVLLLKDETKVIVSAMKPFLVTDGHREARLKGGDTWKFEITSQELEIENERGKKIKDPSTPIWILSREDTGQVLLNGRAYRGRLEIMTGQNKMLQVINELGIEDYLRGVIPSEIGRIGEREFEAACAQAIAARSYALYRMGQREEELYDLESTEADQIYQGASMETPLTDEAVSRTFGLIMKYKGKPIRANYHSLCGGHTANVEEVWEEEPKVYLQGRKDHFCRNFPQFHWERKWDKKELSQMLEENIPSLTGDLPNEDLGEVKEVKIKEKGKSGRVIVLEVRTKKKVYRIIKDKIRSLFRDPQSGKILPSTLFTIKVERGGGIRSLTLQGRGNGHGVGMCQIGALEMAREGNDFRKILRTYYPGVKVARAY